MNGDQLVFLIARFDLLLIAIILLLGDALLWLPSSRERLPHRQLLLGRVFILFLGLLFAWFAVAVEVQATDLSTSICAWQQ